MLMEKTSVRYSYVRAMARFKDFSRYFCILKGCPPN